jgi:hypothetical protein
MYEKAKNTEIVDRQRKDKSNLGSFIASNSSNNSGVFYNPIMYKKILVTFFEEMRKIC